MAQLLADEFRQTDYSSGMIDDRAVADSLMPRNAVRKAVNVQFDRPRGAISQRLGTTQLGVTLSGGNTILGIHNHRQAAASNHQLLAAVTTTIRVLSGTAWNNTVTGLTTGLKTRFLTYLDSTVFMNGTDASQSWTGSGAWTVAGGVFDVANFPVTRFAVILNDRVMAAGNSTNPSRLYESSIASGGTVSWTSGNRNTDIFINDGSGAISGLALTGRVVLVFKDRSLFRYDANSLQRIVNIGTPSHESIVTDDNGIVYFFGQGANGVGFYRTTGGYPDKISRPVIKWVEAIASSFYADVAAFTNGSKVHWSIGSVTIDGTIYSNAWLVYNIADQTWEARNYDDRYRVFSQYISGSTLTVVGGDTDGMVQTIDSGNTDNTVAITSECEMGPLHFTSRSHVKVIDEIVSLATDYQGLNLHIRTDGGPYERIGAIDAREKRFTSFPEKLRGQVFYPKITAINTRVPFVFEGLTFPSVQDEGLIR